MILELRVLRRSALVRRLRQHIGRDVDLADLVQLRRLADQLRPVAVVAKIDRGGEGEGPVASACSREPGRWRSTFDQRRAALARQRGEVEARPRVLGGGVVVRRG
jgi:hypothetical protein